MEIWNYRIPSNDRSEKGESRAAEMSRPILSRPRTRVYGCNYDKGESYYKPMVDHLDRKYCARPLFSEPRTSLADEIAARRNDIGSRDLSGPRNESFGRDLDLDLDPRTRASQLLSPLTSTTEQQQQQQHPLLLPEDEETVYDSRGQRTRRRFADDFANEVASTTRRFKARMAAMELDQDVDSALNKKVEDAETTLKTRRSKLFSDEFDEQQHQQQQRSKQQASSMTRWSKLINDDEEDSMLMSGAAATRARQTKARLDDLETEMEELAERQAKRERRAAALRALTHPILLLPACRTGSRNLSGNRGDYYDDLDFRAFPEEDYEDDFVVNQRRYRERAAAAFEEDLAELRRKRRDMQDRIFDVIDLNAEIEKARTTLEAADIAFQRHATKFDNEEEQDSNVSLAQKLDRTRKLANMELVPEKSKNNMQIPLRWARMQNAEPEIPTPPIGKARARFNSLANANEFIENPLDVLAMQPIKRKFLKRKKSVSF
ncbi:hypothetical protein KPH14_005673 [Odynerus spinipes]|uniref:Uncharacterized protein n=1 Tax=Odynerus spinipes TaxID=1348599 RepID=A0AAD9RAZ4_9HYME|nr:hypothetical protein KPH14_005673 [Odynerus spinipes]